VNFRLHIAKRKSQGLAYQGFFCYCVCHIVSCEVLRDDLSSRREGATFFNLTSQF
jgi:hypothetical protein